MDEQSPPADPSSKLSLDDVARRAGVAAEQLRDWRNAGLVGEPNRDRFSLRDVERARLIQLFVRRGVDLTAIGAWIRSGEMDRHVDLLLPQSGAAYPLAQACATLGLDAAMVRRLWEAGGWNVDLLDDEDLEALRALKPAIEAGFPEAAIAQLVRVFADAMQRVAETEARLFHFYIRNALAAQGLPDAELTRALWQAGEQVSVLDQPALLYFHRKALRHAIADTCVLELANRRASSSAAAPPANSTWHWRSSTWRASRRWRRRRAIWRPHRCSNAFRCLSARRSPRSTATWSSRSATPSCSSSPMPVPR